MTEYGEGIRTTDEQKLAEINAVLRARKKRATERLLEIIQGSLTMVAGTSLLVLAYAMNFWTGVVATPVGVTTIAVGWKRLAGKFHLVK